MAGRIQKKQHPDIRDIARQRFEDADGDVNHSCFLGVSVACRWARDRTVDIVGRAIVKDRITDLADLLQVNQRPLYRLIERIRARFADPSDGGNAPIDFHRAEYGGAELRIDTRQRDHQTE